MKVPALVGRIKRELAVLLKRDGFYQCCRRGWRGSPATAHRRTLATMLRALAGLHEVADEYDGFILDLWD